jgi:hypothetical protein
MKPPARPKPAPPAALVMTRLRRLEADIANLQDFSIKLSSRMLRVELAVSLITPEARTMVFPENEPDGEPSHVPGGGNAEVNARK